MLFFCICIKRQKKKKVRKEREEWKERKKSKNKSKEEENRTIQSLNQGLSGQVALETVSCLFIIFKEAGFHVWF